MKPLYALLLIPFLSGSDLRATSPIDLSRPVDESLPSVTGVHWRFDALDGGATATPDSTINGYTGHLEPGHGTAPHLTSGVDLPGTSGYGSALRLQTAETVVGPQPNPRVYTNLPPLNHLGMADTDFTGGAWLKLNSLLPEAQFIMIMDRGGCHYLSDDPDGGHWSFYLTKEADGQWKLCFQTGDGSTNQEVAIPIAEITTDVWNHYGFSYRHGGEGGADEVTLWLNGQPAGTGPFAVKITSGSSDYITRRFAAGERNTSGYLSIMDGALDDLFVTVGFHPFKPLP